MLASKTSAAPMMPPSAVGQVVYRSQQFGSQSAAGVPNSRFRFGTYAISINEFKGRETLA